MTPDEIKALRKTLSFTQRDLAEALALELDTVRGWERGELFPTKSAVTAMTTLRENPPKRAPRKAPTVWQLLADERFMALVRKLLSDPKLRAEVERLAQSVPDPLDE
jgi:transcriptional regulator with XRE-family HTH domain